MEKTVCELFAGVGGFRCGLNKIKTKDDLKKDEKWKTVWFNQWEPAEKTTQFAHECYIYNFGDIEDIKGEYKTNLDIEKVDKKDIPNHNLLVGGFPCQDYSVASTLSTSKGIEGKKGVLWWSIREVLEAKKPPFVLLENVDRLIKSPAKQRGRDFGIILSCFQEEGYIVEWRVINAADYGFQQRRRRVFIFAYKDTTNYEKKIKEIIFNNKLDGIKKILQKEGFFAKTFEIKDISIEKIKSTELQDKIGDVSNNFKFDFENSGIMCEGKIFTVNSFLKYEGKNIVLGDILETEEVDNEYFIPEEKLYYTDESIKHSDETEGKLPDKDRQTWQYIKGAKKIPRKTLSGHEYVFSEGPVPMVDEYDKPARTLLTSEGGFSRSTHIVRDKVSGRIRKLTAIETERIQGFPDNHTKYCLRNDEIIEMPLRKRRFMMGNALVVNLIEVMEKELSKILEDEQL